MVTNEEIKKKMQQRYDEFAYVAEKEIESATTSDEARQVLEKVRPALLYFRSRKIQTALSLGKFKEKDNILEIGSNMGQYTFPLAKYGFNILGTDISNKAIEVADKRANILQIHNVRFLQQDAENLSVISGNAYDGVVSFSTLRYLPNLDKALSEIYRVLKPSGRAVLDFPNLYCPWFKYLKNLAGVENHFHDHFYSSSQIGVFMQEAGFKDVEIKRILFTPTVTPTALLPFFKAADFFGERVPLINITAAIIMVKGVK